MWRLAATAYQVWRTPYRLFIVSLVVRPVLRYEGLEKQDVLVHDNGGGLGCHSYGGLENLQATEAREILMGTESVLCSLIL